MYLIFIVMFIVVLLGTVMLFRINAEPKSVLTPLQREALTHYECMIQWVLTQDLSAPVSRTEMENAIGESWHADFCPYCQKCNTFLCGDCPLQTDKGCCNGSWFNMNFADSWGDWLKYADKVKQEVIKRG